MTLKLSAISAVALASVLFVGSPAQAQIAYPNANAKALADCVALSTTGRDRLLIARWMALGIGSAKAMKDVVTVNPDVKDETDKQMAAVFDRLFTVDCKAEASEVVKAADIEGFESAGARLGLIAMQELMNDPAVTASLSDYVQYTDQDAVAQLAK
ncbi:MAG: hypothetical protein AAF762_11655 [Pseudomonadota bacterium]